MTITRTLTALAAAASLAACASNPGDVTATYVAPTTYQGMSCAQLNAEAQHISSRLAEASGNQQKAASNDAAKTAVAVILFWPAAFFVSGDKGAATELGRVKGEANALRAEYARKGC